MKKIILLSISFIFSFNIFSQNFCENFEGYSAGDPIAQTSSDWNSWGELMSGLTAPFTDDALVTDLYANNGSFSLGLNLNPAVAGPEDVVLLLSNTGFPTPYVAGVCTLTHNLYITTGAYFNLQAENIPGVTWALDVTFDAMGGVNYASSGSAQSYLMSTYPLNQWFEQKIVMDLSSNNWEVFHDGVSQGSFPTLVNQIASIDYYPTAGQEFFVDDICIDYAAPQLDPLNAQVLNVSSLSGLAGQDRYPSVEIRNFGVNDINSFDVTYDYNGALVTENISGLTLTSMSTYVVNFNNTITLTSATNAQAYIYNINGGQSQNTSDDTLLTNINVVVPAANKIVVGEEATGTWCGWCPRGAVALNWMDQDYEGYWQGIAVHNGDLMTDATYDNGIAGYISGYPSGLVDRGGVIDPSAFNQDFLQRIVIPPHARITNGAIIDGTTLKVSLDVTFLQSTSGTYRLACTLVEDSVTGTGPQYYQANYYSGGASLIDVDGTDWNAKPSNVPDYLMVYRHVARAINPSFLGNPLSSSSYNVGDNETVCFEFDIDPNWDLDKIHIVGMLFDVQGKTDNASSTSIPDAETTGYISCSGSTETIYLNGPDDLVVYPNPASNNLYINNLPISTEYINIINIEGKVVFNTKAKSVIDISDLSKGIYMIKFNGLGLSESRKFVVE
tara:strand:+ start:1951 stop:3963 length:2013 start_codon:yes stop_codon:yes gene_type:complete